MQTSQRMQRSARREQLLSVASEVFGELGYHQTGMDEIAIRAGISKPILYQHFPSKLELYTAVVDAHIDTLITGIKQALTSTLGSKKRLEQSIRAVFDFISQEGNAYKLIFHSDVSDATIQNKILNAVNECVSLVYENIKQDEYLSPFQAHMVASVLVGISQNSARYWLLSPEKNSREEAISLTNAIAWGAYLQARESAKKSSSS